MYEIPQPFSTKYALYPNKKVKKDYDNTLPARNLSSIISDSALKIDFLNFSKIYNSINFKVKISKQMVLLFQKVLDGIIIRCILL